MEFLSESALRAEVRLQGKQGEGPEEKAQLVMDVTLMMPQGWGGMLTTLHAGQP